MVSLVVSSTASVSVPKGGIRGRIEVGRIRSGRVAWPVSEVRAFDKCFEKWRCADSRAFDAGDFILLRRNHSFG